MAVLFGLRLFGVFLAWTLLMYLMHRLAHVVHPANPLWRIHLAHHRVPYLSMGDRNHWPQPGQFLFWLGSWQLSLDVLISMTLPLLLLCWFLPAEGLTLLVLHYLYEVFLSETRLDHNPRIKGAVTRFFAWGHYHLYHHVNLKRNYGLIVTWWDWLFGTARMPDEHRIPHVIKRRQQRLGKESRA